MSKIDMGQIVEEAAKEYIYKARASFIGVTPEEYEEQINPEYPFNVGTDRDFESIFIAGAEWQAKQSPWININDRLPENKDEVLVLSRMNISGKYFVSSDSYDGKEWAVNLAMHYTRVAWIPIPSFDEILEASKDVLQRMKENGD